MGLEHDTATASSARDEAMPEDRLDSARMLSASERDPTGSSHKEPQT